MNGFLQLGQKLHKFVKKIEGILGVKDKSSVIRRLSYDVNFKNP
jgi:hypothetical protein